MIHITSTTESDENGNAFPHSESREEKLLEQVGLKRCFSTVAELKLPWEDWKRILLQLLRNLRICCDVEFSMALQSENIRYHMLSHPRSFRFLEGLALFSSAMSLWTLCRTILGYIYPLSHMAWKINDCHGISHCYVWSLGFSIHPGCTAGILAIFSTHGGTSHTNGGRGENGWQQHVPRTEQCW